MALSRKAGIALTVAIHALLPAACAPGAEVRGEVFLDTLPGGVVRVRNPLPDASTPSWEVVERHRIGAVEGDGPDVFGDIRGFLVDRTKRTFVLDFHSQEIRVFDSLGTHLFSFGGEGSGPGETRAANGLAWSGTNIWVNDIGNARYSVLDPGGRFQTSYRRPVTSFGYDWRGGVDAEGVAYYFTIRPTGPRDREPGVRESYSERILVRLDTACGILDSLPLPQYMSLYYRVPRGTTSIPYVGDQLLRFDARGYIWEAVTDEYRIYQTRLSGDTVRVIERQYEYLPVTPTDRSHAIERIERFMERAGRAHLDYSVIPEFKPALENLDIDDRGRLWVRTAAVGEHTAFDVYDPEGVLIATAEAGFRVPPYRHVVVVGSSMFTVVSDSLDVQYVLIADIRDTRATS